MTTDLSALQATWIQVAGKVEESIVDGPGLRFVLFTQGCPHHCSGCHNPETHDPSGGVRVRLDEVYRKIVKNPLVHGVTLSGGEPFVQASALRQLVLALKKQNFHLMIYSGYIYENLLEDKERYALLELIDVLVDGPFIEAKRSLELPFRGSSNQRILDVPASLAAGKAVLHPAHFSGF